MRNISATNVKLPVDASDLGIFGTFKSHCIQMHHHRHELQIQAARLMVERWVCYLRVLMVWKKKRRRTGFNTPTWLHRILFGW